MLSDILMIAMVVYIMCTPIFIFKAVKFGMRIAVKPEKAAEEPVFNVPKKGDRKRAKEQAKVLERYKKIAQNLDKFNGTAEGQEKIND